MKNLFLKGLLAMTYVVFNPVHAESNKKDEAAIKTIVESIGTLADTRNFEALEKLYAPEIKMDYTSLNGGDMELKSSQTLMAEWAGVLPGFDVTRHAISNIKVTIKGSAAIATADVIAEHYVNDLFWQVKGDYQYELVKDDNHWLVTAHRFNLQDEFGTRDVFNFAVENAKKNPVSYVIRRKTQQAVRDFLTALEEKDMIKFASVWAEDAVQDMPFSPEGFPKRVSGKDKLLEHYGAWPEVSGENSDFTSKLVFYPMVDPEIVFVEFKGNVNIIPTDRVYSQTYGGLFHVENGKIKLFREYYDPAKFKYAFGLDEGGKFN